MGILDDAIREHLELKRQHGAPEEEVQRQQDEALGPARRDVADQQEIAEAAGADGVTDAETELASEVDDGSEPEGDDSGIEYEYPDTDESPAQTALVPPGETPPSGFAAVAEGEGEDEEELAAAGDPEGEVEEYDRFGGQAEEGDRFARHAEDDDDDPFEGDEPFATDDEGADEDDEGEGDGDVLEDTPDFLQETPEHDRLWFEQKPPRDFDFD